MKSVTVNKDQFEKFLYPSVATTPMAGEMSKLRMLDRVLDKLEAVSAAESQPKKVACPNCSHLVEMPSTITGFVLKDDEATIEFEDAEAEFVGTCLIEGMKNVRGDRARTMLPVFKALGID